MNAITIKDPIAKADFEQGKSVQIRAKSKGQENVYEKNMIVAVLHDGSKINARIVSDPLLISSDRDTNDMVYSLIIEKT